MSLIRHIICASFFIIIFIIHHELGLDRPVRPRLIVSSKVFRVVSVHLVYNSALFFASCYLSFLLHILDIYVCIFLVPRQLILLCQFLTMVNWCTSGKTHIGFRVK